MYDFCNPKEIGFIFRFDPFLSIIGGGGSAIMGDQPSFGGGGGSCTPKLTTPGFQRHSSDLGESVFNKHRLNYLMLMLNS